MGKAGRPRQFSERRLDLQLREDQWKVIDWIVEQWGLTQREIIRWWVDAGCQAVRKVEQDWAEKQAKVLAETNGSSPSKERNN